MSDVIQVHDQFYILATSSLADDRTLVLKHQDTFAVFDRYGDIHPVGLGEQGLYHDGTRFLSQLTLNLGADRPLLLSSTVNEDNALLAVDLTNPDIEVSDQVPIPRGTIHLTRAKFLWHDICYERLTFHNYGVAPVDTAFSVSFDADFADIFEVRGLKREQRGRKLGSSVRDQTLILAYEGLDGVRRETHIAFAPAPTRLAPGEAHFDISLPSHGETAFMITVTCVTDGIATPAHAFDIALHTASSEFSLAESNDCLITTDNHQFNALLNRSIVDLFMLITETEHGPYPYAGVPWFSTAFGRDGIITALQFLWVNPDLARGVLTFLATTQARAIEPERDAEPGKILHETRQGEMAALHEIPFGRYYGSVDSTPLFIMLASAYYDRTGDRAFIESIWPNIDLALTWIDDYGDVDGDGFVEYQRQTPQGLAQQGWKDSHDSVFHADGRLAEGPIALCEVQGYVYAARCAAAKLAHMLGDRARAEVLTRQAETLRQRFEQSFWCDDLSMYALALDGQKQPCRVRNSNAGHCLFSGIASQEHARTVARSLLADDMFSGWGIRTLSSTEIRYNPMSYHNGSVWPHDNALIAHGLARYGFRSEVASILEGLTDASLFVDLHRLPELFCGFARRHGEGPTLYPVACAPQAWAAASVFMLLQACLGLSITADPARVTFRSPSLPPMLHEISLRNLSIGAASLDLELHRLDNDVGIRVVRRHGEIEIEIRK